MLRKNGDQRQRANLTIACAMQMRAKVASQQTHRKPRVRERLKTAEDTSTKVSLKHKNNYDFPRYPHRMKAELLFEQHL